MSTRPKLDFQEIKSRVSLEQVMQLLQLPVKKTAGQWRGACPVHAGGERSLAITPGEGWYCHQAHQGGDCIALYAHVKEVNNYDAAAALSEHFRIAAPRPTPKPKETPTDGLTPLDYLEPQHEVLELLGLSPSVCEALGAGYAPRGTITGRIGIPLRMPSGELVGYLAIATRADQAPLLLFPKNLEERCTGTTALAAEEPEKRSTDDMRKLLRVVNN